MKYFVLEVIHAARDQRNYAYISRKPGAMDAHGNPLTSGWLGHAHGKSTFAHGGFSSYADAEQCRLQIASRRNQNV